MNTYIQNESNYRWYILSLGVGTHIFVAALTLACMPVLFPEIAADLQLSLVQIGMIWGFINFPGMLGLSIFGGMLGDKYGTAKVLASSCLATGISCALRGTADGYMSLLQFSVLFGLAQIPLAFTTHKAAGQWFSGKQLGLANGILAMGMGAGGILASIVSATIVSPLLGGWRNVMFLYAGISCVFAVLWLQTTNHNPPQSSFQQSGSTADFRQAFFHVIKLRSLWIIAFSQIFFMIYKGGVLGYLPSYLEGIGWSTVAASGAMSVISTASVIGVIPITIFSDRLGLRKSILTGAYLITSICVCLLSLQNSDVIWPMVILIGFFQEGIAAITITVTMETEGVGATYSGTALGITNTTTRFGAVIGPPLGNKMAEIKPAYGFIFWGLMCAICAMLFIFVKETGWRKKQLHG